MWPLIQSERCPLDKEVRNQKAEVGLRYPGSRRPRRTECLYSDLCTLTSDFGSIVVKG